MRADALAIFLFADFLWEREEWLLATAIWLSLRVAIILTVN